LQAVHTAIELRAELVRHSRDKLGALGCANVDVRHGSCLAIDAESSMRFQRIYVGAGADEAMAAILFGMLELGGILVGPFAGQDGAQRLLRVRRLGEASYQVRATHGRATPARTHAFWARRERLRPGGVGTYTCGACGARPAPRRTACHPLPHTPLPMRARALFSERCRCAS
jgi:protein-L-isoaspartate O-methyltransferase